MPGQENRAKAASTRASGQDPQQSLASPVPWGTACLAVLTQRCSDQAPSIRAKALSLLASAVGEGTKTSRAGGFCQVRVVLRVQDLGSLAAVGEGARQDRDGSFRQVSATFELA